ncbi:uncharacterized protein LOC126835708 isoform X2 [Adelges cooleyi]|uniref:uncharacterized protein LOC126835708 isoform X2 n=1 Tax=Adelges cooleyi TaxID=133065 RepID=UPI0021800363|nr:uncharacterized protein LOC126835708 isoform X2 [Adelges cooleyi]
MMYYCILIPFTFVHILAVDPSDYLKEVDVTNRIIEAARHVYVANAGQNGFEYTIKRLVVLFHKDYKLDQLNYMLAIPDHVHRYFERYIKFQDKMQYEIMSAIVIDRPTARENPVESLQSLGDKRRRMTRQAIKNLLFKEMMKLIFNQEGDFTLMQKCYFIGLGLSTKDGIDFTKTVTMQNDTFCVIKSVNGIFHKYIEFENNLWEVRYNQVNIRIGKFLDQLNEFD